MRYRTIKKFLIQKPIIFYLVRFCFFVCIKYKDVASKLDWAVNDHVTKCLLGIAGDTIHDGSCEGFTTNRTSEIMLHRSVRLHIIHVIARGGHELSRERLGQSFPTSVHHDIGLPYILRAAHPPTYSTFMFTHSFTLTCAPPLSGSPAVTRRLIGIVCKRVPVVDLCGTSPISYFYSLRKDNYCC